MPHMVCRLGQSTRVPRFIMLVERLWLAKSPTDPWPPHNWPPKLTKSLYPPICWVTILWQMTVYRSAHGLCAMWCKRAVVAVCGEDFPIFLWNARAWWFWEVNKRVAHDGFYKLPEECKRWRMWVNPDFCTWPGNNENLLKMSSMLKVLAL